MLRVPIDRTRYVRAVTIRAGSTRVVHHASLGVDATRTARRFDAMDDEAGFDGMLTGGVQSPPGHFIGWAPGKSSQVSPPGLAWRLEPGVDLVLQVHMMPGGKPETVQPSVAFEFTDEAPRERAVLVRLGSTAIDIPPGAHAHVVEDTFDLPSDGAGAGDLSARPLSCARDHERRDASRWPAGSSHHHRRVELPLAGRLPVRHATRSTGADEDHHPRDVRQLDVECRARAPARANRRVVYGGGTSDEMGDVWLQVVPAAADGAARLERTLARRELDAQTRGYQLLASTRPDDPLPRFTLATLYLQAGRFAEAVIELDKVCAQTPSLVMAVYNRGVALQRAGRLAEATRDFRDALARDPRYAEAEHALGHVELSQRRPREAAQHFTKAVELWPEFADAWSSLGTLRASLGAPDSAIEAYNRALAIAPEHREALNNLGILLARQGRIAEAITLLERAVAAHPDDAASRQNLAAARAAAK